MNSTEIRSLRLRLGWTRGDLARRLGCSCEIITQWEVEAITPSAEIIQAAASLVHVSEMYSQRLETLPRAEEAMGHHGLNQISHGQLNSYKKESAT